MSDDVISIQWVPPEYLEENDFNPNVMAEDKFEAMKTEMKEDPAKFWTNNQIRVTPKEAYFEDPDQPFDRFVIIDGAHRWRGAMHLFLEKVPIFIRLLNRAQARRECYRINSQRGSIDPLKEGEMYRIDREEGLSQKDIAEAYGVNQSQVSRSLALTELPETILLFYKDPEATFKKYRTLEWEKAIDENVSEGLLEAINSHIQATGEEPTDEEVADMEEAIRDQIKNWPRYEAPSLEPERPLSRSHLDILGILPTEELQISLALRIMGSHQSVRHFEDQARRLKKDYEDAQFLDKARELAEMKKCPECGEPIKRAKEVDGEILVSCAEYDYRAHWWPVTTTREEWDETKKALEPEDKEARARKETIKLWFKHALPVETIDETLGEVALELAREFETARLVHITGLHNGKMATLLLEGTRVNRVFKLEYEAESKAPNYGPVLGGMFAYNNEYFEPVLRGPGAWPHEKLYFSYKSGDWKKGPYKTRFELGHEHAPHAEELIQALEVFLSNRYVEGAPGILPSRMVGGPVELAREFIAFYEKARAEKEASRE